jgi:hypothetical protein
MTFIGAPKAPLNALLRGNTLLAIDPNIGMKGPVSMN